MASLLPSTGDRGLGPPAGGVEQRFCDIDEQAAALTGWNQRYLQVSAGCFRGGVQRLQLDGIGLFVEDLQQAVHQTGHVRPEVIGLGVPLLLDGDARFCGRASHPGAVHVFSGASGFEFLSPRRHVMLGIEVDRRVFDAQVLDPAAPAAGRFAEVARLHEVDPAAIDALRRCLRGLFDPHAQPHGEPLRRRMRDELLDRLAAVVNAPAVGSPAAGAGAGLQPTAAQLALTERARELVSARLDEPPTVAELCSQLGVSRRTLQNGFQATWGMGPLAWLNLLRLNAVRHRLKTAATVTEAATQLGFWHFGHFARDYQALFGERPSQTLQRHRGAAAVRRMH